MSKEDIITVDDPTAECYKPKTKKSGNASTIIGITIIIIITGGTIYELHKAYNRKEANTTGL